LFVVPAVFSSGEGSETPYQDFRDRAASGEIESAEFNNQTGDISARTVGGEDLDVAGPLELSPEEAELFLRTIPDLSWPRWR
jgi:hypothetical protein